MKTERRNDHVLTGESKQMNAAGYDGIKSKVPFRYTIRNKKTGAIVEVAAMSSYHACNLVGWRPRNVVLMAESPNAVRDEDTVGSSGPSML